MTRDGLTEGLTEECESLSNHGLSRGHNSTVRVGRIRLLYLSISKSCSQQGEFPEDEMAKEQKKITEMEHWSRA